MTIISTPLHSYHDYLNKSDYIEDEQQAQAITYLQDVYEQIMQESIAKTRRLYWIFGQKKTSILGVYLWGEVGRGKTWLMDLFYNCLPIKRKLRIHFHHFMALIHQQLALYSGKKNPLKMVAKHMSQQYRIICFDEFIVSDIADAMLLGRLLTELFKQNVILIATSNTPPNKLYLNGLQRSQFLPAIAQINLNTQVVNLGGIKDYRLAYRQQQDRYYYPLNCNSRKKMQKKFNDLTQGNNKTINYQSIMINKRSIDCIAYSHRIAWFSFSALCQGPRSQSDYILLSQQFAIILISDVPMLTDIYSEQVKRFIYLIDELYDHHILVIITAEVPINKLYRDVLMQDEFKRTISRLQEMQTEHY